MWLRIGDDGRNKTRQQVFCPFWVQLHRGCWDEEGGWERALPLLHKWQKAELGLQRGINDTYLLLWSGWYVESECV